ncbi:MAG: hypothetical protein WC564_05460 [Patescibacteria group bacterium]|jgi:hypothetical protein
MNLREFPRALTPGEWINGSPAPKNEPIVGVDDVSYMFNCDKVLHETPVSVVFYGHVVEQKTESETGQYALLIVNDRSAYLSRLNGPMNF